RWKTNPQVGSNLQKNEELKSVILQETPWLMEGLSDSLQKQNLAKLVENALLDISQSGVLAQLAKYQAPNGGFSWFEGGRDDRFITQYIITGLGHLSRLGAGKTSAALDEILNRGINYLDKRIAEDYALLLKNKADLKLDQTGYTQIQYLYTRSFFPELPIAAAAAKSVAFYKAQAGKYWVGKNKFMQGMIALVMSRGNQSQIATNILRSLKENSIHSDELGTYWKDIRPGYYWYQAPVETQALLIEAFTEIGKDNVFADELRTWLLKQKQTTHWPSTKATADACYALLLRGTNWLEPSRDVDISLGTTRISSNAQNTEAGTGYFKQTIPGNAVTADMGKISVSLSTNSTVQTNAPAWGAVYWQYFETVEKITASATGVTLTKKLFIEKNSDRGPVLVVVREGDAIKVGDKVKVRIEMKSDRDLEYVQLKDMRASSFEPVIVLSGYKWAGGLGYYESTSDASTSFFFDRLPKGTHVFEYPLFAAQKGNFSNGITTVQCLYAPEFTSHSEGIRVNVE
ncbi:MAG: alpha-2-macroglobulin, partial [Chitinophagaceae bacterium]